MASGPSVSFTVQGLEGIDRMIEFLSPGTFERAIRAGLAQAGKATPPAAAKAIGREYNLLARRIKADISGPFIRGDQATLLFSRRPPTLGSYGFKPGRRGGPQPGLGRGLGWGQPSPAGRPATASILRGQRQQYPSTFLAPSRSGQLLPFRPVGGYSRNGRRRLAVTYGPSIGSLFAGKSEHGPLIRAEVESRISEQFIKGFQRVLDSAARGY
jgi:hypothetical protein